MNFFKRRFEANKVRETLSIDKLPIDEDIFCSAISNGRVKKFEKLNDLEFEGLRHFINGMAHSEILMGIYSIAEELKIMDISEKSEANDEKIIDYLKGFEIINLKSEYELSNARGSIITFKAPLKCLSFYAISLFALLLSQVYLKRSAIVN